MIENIIPEAILPAEQGLKKRCRYEHHEGDRWIPVQMFSRDGMRKTKNGTYVRKGICKKCQAHQGRERTKQRVAAGEPKRKTFEEKERARKILRARRKAYRRLAAMNEEGFKYFLREELEKEGVSDYRYISPNGEWNL